MSWYSMDCRCSSCHHEWDTLVQSEDKDRQQECPSCHKVTGHRIPSPPNHTRASFVDGTKRFDKLRQQDAVDRAISESTNLQERKSLLIESDRVKSKKT